jgi:hypothetical protein
LKDSRAGDLASLFAHGLRDHAVLRIDQVDHVERGQRVDARAARIPLFGQAHVAWRVRRRIRLAGVFAFRIHLRPQAKRRGARAAIARRPRFVSR